MSNDIHLYGIDGWENLYTDLSSAVEHWLDDCIIPDDGEFGIVTFSEWDTVPVRNHMPSAGQVLEYIHEWTCENGCVDDGFHDSMQKAVEDSEVVLKMEHVLDLIASKVPYRMADKVVATHQVKIAWPDTEKLADWDIVNREGCRCGECDYCRNDETLAWQQMEEADGYPEDSDE